VTNPLQLIEALTSAGWTVAGKSERQCYVRLAAPYRTGTAFLMVPTDETAPEYSEMLQAALGQLQATAQLGDLAWRVLDRTAKP
jgi:hypothetical protein